MTDSATKPAGQNGQSPRKPTADLKTDRLPPHSVEAETGVIGCILLSPTDCLLNCHEIGVKAEWFYDLRLQTIYHNLERLFQTLPPETAIDIIILQQRLKETGQLEQVGGIPALSTLQDAVPSAANLSYYLDIVREKWLLRAVVQACTQAVGDIYEHQGSVDGMLAEMQERMGKLAEESISHTERKLVNCLPEVIDDIEDYHRGHAQVRGLPLGIPYVDKMLCGIGQKNGNLLVLSARPGIGKTALACQIALSVALDCDWFEPKLDAHGNRVVDAEGNRLATRHHTAPVGIFSLEMAMLALVDRMVWQRAKGDKQRWRNGFAVKEDFSKLATASAEMAKAEIYIDDTPRMSIEELCAKARRMHRQYGIKLFVVDYIQLLHSTKNYKNERVQELGYISGMLQTIAKLLNVPFIVLAQMNRDYEKEPNRTPRLSDLKDCGAIEQDADLVMFLYGPKLNKTAEEECDDMLTQTYGNDWVKRKRVNLLVEKNRYGMTGDCQLLFHKNCTQFEDWNDWMKAHGHKAAAAGERKQATMIDPEDVP